MGMPLAVALIGRIQVNLRVNQTRNELVVVLDSTAMRSSSDGTGSEAIIGLSGIK